MKESVARVVAYICLGPPGPSRRFACRGNDDAPICELLFEFQVLLALKDKAIVVFLAWLVEGFLYVVR